MTDVEFTSPGWWVASRTGGAVEAVLGIDLDVRRVPRLLVPVDVQALVVTGASATGDRADVRSRMLDESPTRRLPPPFATVGDLAPGVHLHWALPDGLTRSRPAPPGSPERDLRLRPLPDRWLVARLGRGAGKRPVKAWVVESERGRTVELEKWDPTAPFTGTAPVESAKLNAATGGDLAWAAVYDNVRDRFAFHDDLADLGTGRPVLSYVVVGWYSQPSLDPLAPPTVPAGMRDLLDDLGWDADLSSLDRAEDWSDAVLAPIELLARRAGVPVTEVTGAGGTIAAAPPSGTVMAREAAAAPLGVEGLKLKDGVTRIPGRRAPRVTQSLYHGTIHSVHTDGSVARDARPAAGAVALVMGANGIEALTKLLAGSDAAQERLLNAFVYGTIRDLATDDGLVALDEALHRHGFTAIPDPSPGAQDVVRDQTPGAPPPPPMPSPPVIGTIDVGSISTEMFRIDFAGSRFAAGQRVLSTFPGTSAAMPGPTTPGTIPGGGPGGSPPGGTPPGSSTSGSTPAPTYTAVTRPNPRWFQPGEAVLGLRGCERSLRHGYDGRFDPGERLACRLSGQPVRGYADLLSGDEVLAPFAHGGLPAECGELLREAALSDPDAVDELSGLVPSSRGWTKAQIRARLRAEMVLDYYVHGRQEDVGELLDASLKEGVEPSPVGMTYWRQPWIPLYAEWSASLKHTDRVTGWSLSEVDFDTPGEDELHALALDTVTLSGRSLLNSSGARTLASAVDAFLHAETRLDEDGRGVLSDADADDLAQLALVAARSDVLSAALDGVNDHFLGFDADTAFADPDADAPVVSPARLPQLLRAGWLRLERLRVVDAFGRYLDLDAELTSLTRADTLVGDRAPDFAAPAAAPPAQLPPRFTAPARLQLRFLDAADDDAEARVDESSAFVAGNPVAGWLLPDHADDALEFFDAEGSPLGQLFHRGVGSDVTWEGAPGKPGPLGAGPDVDLAGSRHLSRLAVAVVQRDAVTRAGGDAQDESPLGALLRAIDTTLWTVDPIGATGLAPVSVIVGRPIAVVRARIGVELYDDSADYALSPADAAERSAAFAAMADRGVPVRLGSLGRFDDGVLGFFVDDDYSLFHPVHPAVLELARSGGAEHGFLAGQDDAAAFGDALTAEPLVHPYLRGESELLVRPGQAVRLTLLVVAGRAINASSGVVPRKRLELNRSWTDEALQRILPSFRFGPVLVDPDQIRMPRVSALPERRDGDGRQTWTRRDTPTSWRDDAILAATMAARLADTPPAAQEGWIRLMIDDTT